MSTRRKLQLIKRFRGRKAGIDRPVSDKLIIDYLPFKTTLVYRFGQRFSAPGIDRELALIQQPSPGSRTSLGGLTSYERGHVVNIVLYRTRAGRYVEPTSGAQFVEVSRDPDPRDRPSRLKMYYSGHGTSVVATAPPPDPPPPPPRRRRNPPPSQPRVSPS